MEESIGLNGLLIAKYFMLKFAFLSVFLNTKNIHHGISFLILKPLANFTRTLEVKSIVTQKIPCIMVMLESILSKINPLYTSRLFHYYMLDESICHFRVLGLFCHFYSILDGNSWYQIV